MIWLSDSSILRAAKVLGWTPEQCREWAQRKHDPLLNEPIEPHGDTDAADPQPPWLDRSRT